MIVKRYLPGLLQTILNHLSKARDRASPVEIFPDRQWRVIHFGVQQVVCGCGIGQRPCRRTDC
jgi:hypothetical protein